MATKNTTFFIPIKFETFDLIEFKRFIRKYGLEGKGLMIDVLIELQKNNNSMTKDALVDILDILHGDDNVDKYMEMINYCDDIVENEGVYSSIYIGTCVKSILKFSTDSKAAGRIGGLVKQAKIGLSIKDANKLSNAAGITKKLAQDFIDNEIGVRDMIIQGASEDSKAILSKL